MNNLPIRKQTRLKDYDYSQNGAYFITICVKDKRNILWDSSRGDHWSSEVEGVKLSKYGLMVENSIKNIPIHYPLIKVDKYVVMPNHIHIILFISSDENGRTMRAPTISTVISQLKGFITKQVGFSMWQKLFHDHIIRNEEDYQNIWKYIDENPLKWQLDCYYTLK